MCERYKEYRIKKSLPKSTYTKDELKKNESMNVRSLINNIDPDYTEENTKTTNTINTRKIRWTLKH